MRFDEIQIPAFGPFTDFSLSLPKRDEDLHLIYGPNEAGKSSLLRGLRSLLYGFPGQSPDNFRHRYQDFRIGATVSHQGESLTFFRKKGRLNTLLQASGEVLPDQVLTQFLGPVDENFFEHMFGLDTDGLRRGADELLAGQGEFGAAILSAARGGGAVNEAIRALESEAGELFKKNSTKTVIPQLIARYQKAVKAESEASVSTHRWQQLAKQLREAEGDFEEKEKARQKHEVRRSYVDRCLQALPIAQKLHRLEEELAGIELPELPSDFVKRVREAQQDFAAAEQAMESHQRTRETHQSNLDAIADPARVLARSGDLEELLRKSEVRQSALDSIPPLKRQLGNLEERLPKDLSLDDLPALEEGTMDRLRSTADELRELRVSLDRCADECANLEARIKESTKSLRDQDDQDDLGALRELVEEGDKMNARRAILAEGVTGCERLKGAIERLKERLEITGDPRVLQIASRDSISGEERRRIEFEDRIRDLEKESRACRDELSHEQAALDHLANEAALYASSDLKEARANRDALWQESLETGKPNEALTEAIRLADEVVDALREDAGHQAKASGHRSRIATLTARQSNLDGDLAAAREAMEQWAAAWEKNHARQPGQKPVDLLGWRSDWEELCAMTGELAGIEEELETFERKESALVAKFGEDDFESGYRTVRRRLEKANAAQGQKAEITKQLQSDQRQLDQKLPEKARLEAEKARLMEDWNELCDVAAISQELSYSDALNTLEASKNDREDLLKLHEVRSSLKEREELVEGYQALLERCCGALEFEGDVSELFRLFDDAKKDKNRRDMLTSQLLDLDKEEPGLSTKLERAQNEVGQLKTLSGSDDLEPAVISFEQRKVLQGEVSTQIELLEGFAGSIDYREFLKELKQLDAAALAEEYAGLEEAGKTLQLERDRSKEALDELRRQERSFREASDLAAHHRQEATDAGAEIDRHTRRFRRLHHAIDFLREQVAQYRERVQGPMVNRTSDFFQTMTGGAFKRIVVRPDEGDVPRLYSIRSSGEEVPVDGLSEGTRDQLYLALRFAAIDLHLETHPPMPLILDDLLMTFDDDRVAALMPVLVELSRKTQILAFTHHAHLKELMVSAADLHDLSAG